MIWILPVKASSMDKKDFFLLEEIQDKLLIIIDTVHFSINFREDVKTRLRFDCRQTWNILNGIVNEVSLLIDTATWQKQFIHRLVTSKRCLDDLLGQDVGAQAHVGEHV